MKPQVIGKCCVHQHWDPMHPEDTTHAHLKIINISFLPLPFVRGEGLVGVDET